MSVASPPPPPPPPLNSKYTVKGVPGTMCRYCAMQFDTEEELSTHVLTHTRGAAPLKCTMCGQTYRTSSKLQRHIRVHSGERPYTCHICGRRFSRSDHLKQHSKVHLHHRTKNTCRICNARFVGSHLLKAHLRSHGIKNVQTCTTCGEAFENSIELDRHKKLHEVKQQNLCASIRKKNSLSPEEVSNGNSEEVSEELVDESKWMGCARFCLVQSNNKNNSNNNSDNNSKNDYIFETIENHENGWLEIIGKLVEADYAEQKARNELEATASATAAAASAAEENSSEVNSNCDAVNQNSGVENQNLVNKSSVKALPNLTSKISSDNLDSKSDKEYVSSILLGLHSGESSLTSNVTSQPQETEQNSDDNNNNVEEWTLNERLEVMETSEDFSSVEPSSKNTTIRVCYSMVGSGEDINGDEFGNIEAETITYGTKMFVVPSTSDYEENDQDGIISSRDLHNSLRNGEVISDDQGVSYTVSLISKQPLANNQTNSTISNSRSEPFQIGNKKVSHCKHCGIWFEDFAICMLHNSLHLANDDPFTCKKCLKKLGNRLEFMAHLLWHLEPPRSTSTNLLSTSN